MISLPSFDADEVELLASAVQKTLEHLREANERIGGNDPELIQTGRRYAILLQKLQFVSNPDQRGSRSDGGAELK